METIKLYKREGDALSYWEAWESDEKIIVHQGRAGEDGEVEDLKATKSAREKVEAERLRKTAEGYAPIPEEEMSELMIEYKVADDADHSDWLDELENLLDDTLGWTGLGYCDGNDPGEGILEVACLVVDFEMAKRVIEADLKGTEFVGYTRIYRKE